MPPVLFEFKDVSVTLGGRRVLDGLSWELREGECAVLLGRSGSGKTVFLHTLLGLLTPQAGTASAAGLGGGDLFGHVAVMFQEDSLLDERTVEANIATAIEERADAFGGPFAPETEHSIDAVLREVQLNPAEKRRKLPSALSGGEQRRVALARALARRPRVLIADEPTTGLDPASSAAIYDLLGGLIRARGMSALIITHDPACASRLGYPVYYLSPVEGRLPRWPAPGDAPPEERHKSLLLWMNDQVAADLARRQNAPAPEDRPVSPAHSAAALVGRLIDGLGAAGLIMTRLAAPPGIFMFLRNFMQWGVGSLPLAALIFVLLGVVMQAQSENAVLQYGSSRFLPELLAMGLLRLSPILTGFLVAGRCGSAIGAHTGYMQLSGQFRALRTMRIDPEKGLFPPLFWALTAAVPLLALAGIWLGALGALIVLKSPLSHARISVDFFLSDFPLHLTAGEISVVIVKGMLIGAGIALIAFSGGARPKRSPAEVTSAITGGLVAAFVWITCVDTAMSLLFP